MTEQQALADLAIKHYAGKLRTAKILAESHHLDLDFWARVRKLYLELGGLYIYQLLPRDQAQYFNGAHYA